MEEEENLESLYGGIFSYIEDEATAISYRHSDKIVEYSLGSSKFNDYSKNWRELLYIDLDNKGFIASRQYPYYNEEISKQVRIMLEGLFCEKYGLEDIWKSMTSEESDFFERFLVDCEDPLHYNDMLNGFEGKIIYNKKLDNLEDIDIIVGSGPVCPICGQSYISDSNYPACDNCYDEHLSN